MVLGRGGLGGLAMVMLGLDVVAMREMGVVGGLLVVSVGGVLVSFVVVLGRLLVVPGGVGMMIGGRMRVFHRGSPSAKHDAAPTVA